MLLNLRVWAQLWYNNHSHSHIYDIFSMWDLNFLYSYMYTQESPLHAWVHHHIATLSLKRKLFINPTGPLQDYLWGYVGLPAPHTFVHIPWTFICARVINLCPLLQRYPRSWSHSATLFLLQEPLYKLMPWTFAPQSRDPSSMLVPCTFYRLNSLLYSHNRNCICLNFIMQLIVLLFLISFRSIRICL